MIFFSPSFGRYNGEKERNKTEQAHHAQSPWITYFTSFFSLMDFKVLAEGPGAWVITQNVLLLHLSQTYLSICSQCTLILQISIINNSLGLLPKTPSAPKNFNPLLSDSCI